tara:strand:+ start:1168 stop:1488 length:321 start_codon:yes stop_codon:yes gene_type:complete
VAFKIEKSTLKLVLDDCEGAEVICKANISLGEMLSLRDLGSSEDGIREAYATFAKDVLISWDIEDDAGVVPVTEEGMLRLPSSVAAAIMAAWGEQLTAVPTKPSTE